jgi:hypothetical protein
MHRDAFPGGGDSGLFQQHADFGYLVRCGDGDNLPSGTRARGAAGSMHISLVLDGRISMDHQRHVINMDPARRNIGSHKRRRLTAGKCG